MSHCGNTYIQLVWNFLQQLELVHLMIWIEYWDYCKCFFVHSASEYTPFRLAMLLCQPCDHQWLSLTTLQQDLVLLWRSSSSSACSQYFFHLSPGDFKKKCNEGKLQRCHGRVWPCISPLGWMQRNLIQDFSRHFFMSIYRPKYSIQDWVLKLNLKQLLFFFEMFRLKNI